MERFVEFTRLSAHQLVSAKPTEGVCLTAQKSYKSGQIEQIDTDGKGFVEFGKICRISRRSRLKKNVPPSTDVLMSRQASKSYKSGQVEQIEKE
ncbi:hypothetical protein JHU38_05825 [Prevotella sp. A2931]|uniref:Uncharacterized protein n=1 Tax=Prevotella illustrans TaxID=2800387 RepID=A0ABS3M539_9BACT|nr:MULTISPECIES: hypothetical protein [Prevotella]MBO1363293.1 hypothetical protein [Prevotella illustrans]PTL25835.1 hypothetical protein C3V39_01330 [Prevotella sp. oral taxon 820]